MSFGIKKMKNFMNQFVKMTGFVSHLTLFKVKLP